MRRTIMSEIMPSKQTTSIRSAERTQSGEGHRVIKTDPDNQEGTKGREGRGSSGRILNGEKGVGWSGRRPVASRGHQGDSVSDPRVIATQNTLSSVILSGMGRDVL